MESFDQNEIAKKYNSIDTIWKINDKWHWATHKAISEFISTEYSKLEPIPASILNAGSGGNNYSMPSSITTHIDLAEKRLMTCEKKIVGTIENIPQPSESFDLIVCVGSVINYCDPVKAIGEFERVSSSLSTLILEFENSRTLELVGSKVYNRKALLTDTFYNGQKERLWYYSESFIIEILESNNYKIKKIKRFHILSPFIYRYSKREKFAAFFKKFDFLVRHIPFLGRNSSNVLILAQKGIN